MSLCLFVKEKDAQMGFRVEIVTKDIKYLQNLGWHYVRKKIKKINKYNTLKLIIKST